MVIKIWGFLKNNLRPSGQWGLGDAIALLSSWHLQQPAHGLGHTSHSVTTAHSGQWKPDPSAARGVTHHVLWPWTVLSSHPHHPYLILIMLAFRGSKAWWRCLDMDNGSLIAECKSPRRKDIDMFNVQHSSLNLSGFITYSDRITFQLLQLLYCCRQDLTSPAVSCVSVEGGWSYCDDVVMFLSPPTDLYCCCTMH